MASVIPWTLAMIGLLLFTAFFPYWWSRTGYTLSYRGRDFLVPLVLVGGFVLSLYLIFDDIVFSLLLGV